MKRKKLTEAEEASLEMCFELAFGAAFGFMAGIAQAESTAQLLGKPHDEKLCLIGKKCSIHGTYPTERGEER